MSESLPLTGRQHQTSESTSFSGERVSVLKELVTVVNHPKSSDLYFFWDDGTYSRYDFEGDKFYKILGPLSFPASSEQMWRGWPAGKVLKSVVNHPKSSDLYFFWDDGAYSRYDFEGDKFYKELGSLSFPASSEQMWRGWPAGKVLKSVVNHPKRAELYFFWDDNTYSSYSWDADKFLEINSTGTLPYPASSKQMWRDWPAGKVLKSVVNHPKSDDLYFFWDDNTYSRYGWDADKFKGGFPAANNDGWLNWPDNEVFDPAQHEVRDVRVNQYSAGNGAIYANGKMQYKVEVRVQIVDRNEKGVNLTDRRTGVNQAGQRQHLVTLYRGDKRVDTAGANLAIDNVGDYASNSWTASRNDRGYDKYLNVFAHYSEQIDGTVVEHDQDDDAAYPASDGWQSYVYWVSSTEQTGPDPMRICARVGSYGLDGKGYYDSCADGRNEFARVRSQAPKQYGASDYIVSRRSLGSFDMGGDANHVAIKVNLKGASIRTAENVGGVTGGNNGDVRCIAT
ncbi:TPA: hypothetical protein ACSP1Y_004766, partial [Aeromonas hydrophila]